MWLVAGVDDRSFERRLETDLLLEEIGPLTQLERLLLSRVGDLLADLACPGIDLARHQVRSQLVDDLRERHGSVDQVVLMTAVGVALTVRIVLVDHDLLARRQKPVRGLHGAGQDQLSCPVVDEDLSWVRAFWGRVLRMSVVDVVAGAVGENRVHEVRLDLRWHRALTGIASSVAAGRLVLEVPSDLAVESSDVRVDQERGRRRRAHVVGRVHADAVLGLDPADLRYRHSRTLP